MPTMRSPKALVDDYFTLLGEMYEHFGYVEDWCVFPLHDQRDVYWFIAGGDERGMGGTLVYSPRDDVREQYRRWHEDGEGGAEHYESAIYTQRFLPRWVWRPRKGPYVLVLVDTHTDGNKWLAVLDGNKER